MRRLLVLTAYAAIAAAVFAQRAPTVAAAPPADSPADNQTPGEPSDGESDAGGVLPFAAMWMPVPRFCIIADEVGAGPIPSASYGEIWQPEVQQELNLSPEQKKSLLAINDKARAEVKRHQDRFNSLPPAKQKAEQKAWAGGGAPWWKEIENDIHQQIQALLTPQQLQALERISFPVQTIQRLMYDASLRKAIAFGSQQEDRIHQLSRERLARFQDEWLKAAEKVWALLSPRQQTEIFGVVKHQGPTSAILSIAFDVGFDEDAMALSYPMLSEASVRERLGLTPEQEKQLQAVMADTAAKAKKARQEAAQQDLADNDKSKLESILTSQQLRTLIEIDFRRKVVLALGYPEKREKLGISDQQQADLRRLELETHEHLYRIDRELLAKALETLTPAQREQLK